MHRVYTRETLDEILIALDIEHRSTEVPPEVREWAFSTRDRLSVASRTALMTTLPMLRRGANLKLQTCLDMELKIMKEFLKTSDFHEGVKARAEKRAPNW